MTTIRVPPIARLPLMAIGMVAVVWGMWVGLARMGAAPVVAPRALADHGPLMVGGFLGTVIALERAVASGRVWAYLGPLGCAAGVALMLAGQPSAGAFALWAGSGVVVAVLAQVLRHDPVLHHVVLAAASVVWCVGNGLFAFGRPVFDVVPLWLVFLVGTIAAERLELTRVLPRTRATRTLFLLAGGVMVTGAFVALVARNPGLRLLGLGELALALWMFRFDIARRTIRQTGATRFIAAALLAGYFWLGLGGLVAVVFGHPVAGPRYDALIHAVMVGFVFSMIFGHALVILPAIAGVRVTYTPRFWAHLGLLHASIALRAVGDLAGLYDVRRAGAWLNAIAILLFVANTALSTRRARKSALPPAPSDAPVAGAPVR